jgi:hypothetical protein
VVAIGEVRRMSSSQHLLGQRHEINTSHVSPRQRICDAMTSNDESTSVTRESDVTHLDITDYLMHIRESGFTAIDIGEPGA